VTYAAGSGPATVFLKMVDPKHAGLVEATSGLFHEPRLFRSGVPLPLDHPRVHAVAIDEPGRNWLMVMEDVVARGADPRDATRPMTVEQAASGLRALARMHGRLWGERGDRERALDWLAPFNLWPGLGPAIPIALRRLGETVPPEVHELGKRIVDDFWPRFIDTLPKAAQTLVHGDAHIGNTYVLPDDDVGFLDWQVVRRSNWSIDVGYFLQGAITQEDRRANERDLVELYRSNLDLPEAERPSADEAWLRYRASVAHGLATWLATAADPGGWQRPDISMALAQRYAAAFVELDTPAALEELA
jgi:Ser/Thr protein kinase RdoA (MazF antagonist)